MGSTHNNSHNISDSGYQEQRRNKGESSVQEIQPAAPSRDRGVHKSDGGLAMKFMVGLFFSATFTVNWTTTLHSMYSRGHTRNAPS